VSAFFLSIREGLEAVLIISILLGSLRRIGRMDLARYIWLGVGVALIVSTVVATSLSAAGIELRGTAEAVFEGSTLLLAAVVLTGMLFWMRGQGSALSARLATEVQRAAQAEDAAGPQGQTAAYGRAGLFSVAFLAVVKEGIELALLLAASVFGSSVGAAALGAVVGIATAATLGILLFRGAVRLNFKRFFQVSNIVMIVFAAGMVVLGVHEFVEAGLLPGMVGPIWNTGAYLSDDSGVGALLRALFGYISDPTLTEVLAYLVYLAVVGWALWLKPRPQVAAVRR
jgi:high-affinity iron transporter